MFIPQAHAALAKYPEIELAIVFGSVARGEARRDSDIDVAVQLLAALDAAEKMQLIAIIAAITGRPVDLLDFRPSESLCWDRPPNIVNRFVGRLRIWPPLVQRHVQR